MENKKRNVRNDDNNWIPEKKYSESIYFQSIPNFYHYIVYRIAC